MAKLTRTQKFAELRDKLSNDAETSVSTNELNQFENKLKNIEGYSAPVKDISNDVHEYIFPRNEEVIEKPVYTKPETAKTGDDYFNNNENMPDAFKAFSNVFGANTPKYEEKPTEYVSNNQTETKDSVHEYIFTRPEDISDHVTNTVKAVLNNDGPTNETANIEEIGKYENKVDSPVIDNITIVTNPGLNEDKDYAEEPISKYETKEEPLYTYKPAQNPYETKKEEPLYTYKPAEPVTTPVIEAKKEEEPLYTYKPQVTPTITPVTSATSNDDGASLYTYKPSDSFNYETKEEPKVVTPVVEVKKEEEPLYTYKPSFPDSNYTNDNKYEPFKSYEDVKPVITPKEEDIKIADGKSFLDEALNDVRIYSQKEGLQTVDEISPAIIDEIRGHKANSSRPLDANDVKTNKQNDEEFSNTVSLEINKILAELNKKQQEEENEVISEVKINKPVDLPELDASNYSREPVKAETSFVANYMKDTEELPINEEVKNVYQDRTPDVITNPGLKLEEDAKKDVVEIKNYSEVEDEIKKEITEEKTIDQTIPFVVSDNVNDDEEEEDSAPNKLLNVILIVLIVALIAVLGVIVYYILLAKGIIQ